MFPSSSSSLSLLKVITGISKTLGIIREVIPIYEQAKPMVAGLRNIVTKMPRPNVPASNQAVQSIPSPNEKITIANSNSNSPAFFL